MRQQREGKKAEGDRPSERPLTRGPFRIDMERVWIAGQLSEPIYQRLFDSQPIRDADLGSLIQFQQRFCESLAHSDLAIM